MLCWARAARELVLLVLVLLLLLGMLRVLVPRRVNRRGALHVPLDVRLCLCL